MKKNLSIEEKLKEALIPKEEQPYELPAGWEWVKLRSITEKTQYGYTAKTSVEGNVKYLRITDIQDNQVIWNNVPYCEIEETEKSKYLLIEDDIVVARTGATTGKSYLVKNPKNSVFASYLIRIRGSFKNSEFLWKFMQTSLYWNQITELSSGIAQPGVNAQKLENLKFPLPPIQEQNCIVEKLDSMLGKIKEAKDLIAEAKETFETRRVSILNKAFRGELTEKWRNENPSEDAMKLLKKINEEKLKRWDEECSEAEKSGKKKPAKPKLLSPEEMLVPKEEQPYELPDGWRWISLKNICEDFKYGTSEKSSNTGKKIVLRMGNLQNGKIDWNNLAYTCNTEDMEKYNLLFNDLLFNRTNSPELVGKTSIYKEEYPAIYAGYLIRIRALEILSADYLNFFMNSSFIKNLCKKVKTDGVSQSNINAQKLGLFPIPFPPLTEQQEIVKRVEELLKAEEEASDLLDMEDSIELLEKSILDKAFRGELGTSDVSDEPAIEMLKRIL